MKKTRKISAIGAVFGIILLIACIFIANFRPGADIHGNADSRPAKYIFLFIGDGMGASHVAATESYRSYLEGKKGCSQLEFTKFPVLGMATTYSADRNVTCSSAAGTAISCGEKTCNGRLGIDPEGDTLTSMSKILKERGYKVAIMSSVPVNHATPAAFYGHNISRHDYYGITSEIPASGYDFIAGSGFVDFCGKDGKSERSSSMLERNGYDVCFGEAEYEKAINAGARKIVLCQERFRDKDAPTYIVDTGAGTDISSENLMKKCLGFLGDKDPFFVMYEQGEIDWAAHENKTMPMIESVRKLDNAVKVALEFYRKHQDETLIIVTADHETGGIALGATDTWDEVNLGWGILDSIWNAAGHTNNMDEAGNKAANDRAFIGWTTHGHTGSPVPVYAIGRGECHFGGRYDNTDIKDKILGE